MKVTAPADFSHVTPLGRGVEKSETVEVDETLGAQLVAQGWKPTAAAKKKPIEIDAPVAPEEEQ